MVHGKYPNIQNPLHCWSLNTKSILMVLFNVWLRTVNLGKCAVRYLLIDPLWRDINICIMIGSNHSSVHIKTAHFALDDNICWSYISASTLGSVYQYLHCVFSIYFHVLSILPLWVCVLDDLISIRFASRHRPRVFVHEKYIDSECITVSPHVIVECDESSIRRNRTNVQTGIAPNHSNKRLIWRSTFECILERNRMFAIFAVNGMWSCYIQQTPNEIWLNHLNVYYISTSSFRQKSVLDTHRRRHTGERYVIMLHVLIYSLHCMYEWAMVLVVM